MAHTHWSILGGEKSCAAMKNSLLQSHHVGEVKNGASIILPEGVSPGHTLIIETHDGTLESIAPPNARPGLEVQVPDVVACPLPSTGKTFRHVEVRQTGDKCSIDVEFDRSPPYHVGDTVSGKVVVAVNSEFNAKHVTAKIGCKLHGTWTDGVKSEQVHRRHNIIVLDQALWTGCILKPGVHTFPFTCSLPMTACPTLSGGAGLTNFEAVWSCKVTIGRSVMRDLMMKTPFDVYGVSRPPQELTTPSWEVTEVFPLNCCCLSSGSIQLELWFGGPRVFDYAPDGFITGLLWVRLTNSSSKLVIKRVNFEFLETVSVWHRELTHKVGKFTDDTLHLAAAAGGEGSTTVEKHLLVRFPQGRYPTTPHPLLRTSHTIAVTIQTSSPVYSNPSFSIPIYIG